MERKLKNQLLFVIDFSSGGYLLELTHESDIYHAGVGVFLWPVRQVKSIQ